ncbi:MAG: hypothetical protein ABMA64_37830, partial [Myxococcota bacterium]
MFLTLWCWLLGGFASAHDVTFCVDVNVDYNFSSAGGDYWTDNAVHKAARGFHFELTQASPSVFRAGHLAESDSDAGCITLTGLPFGTSYQLRIFPSAEVSGNTILHDDASEVVFGKITVNANATKTFTISYSDEAYQQLVAAAFAVHNHDLGTAATVTLHFCNTANCSYTYGAGNDIDLAHDADKYVIAHEVGHALMFQQSEIDAIVCGCSEGCDGGDNINRKWWAQAFKEGIAWWYAMITWNAKAGGDCDWLNNQLLDFDLDQFDDYAAGEHLACWGDPDAIAPDHTDGEDWLADLFGHNGCTGTATNHTTEYDIVHYAWGLYAYGSDTINNNANDLTADEVMDLLLAADPSTWDPNQSTYVTSDDPWDRWDAAAASFGANSRIYKAHSQQERSTIDFPPPLHRAGLSPRPRRPTRRR